MSRWVSQQQLRSGSHDLIHVFGRRTWENDEEIGILVSKLIGLGYTVDRSDSISVTLRGPQDGTTGQYSFVHCWKEG